MLKVTSLKIRCVIIQTLSPYTLKPYCITAGSYLSKLFCLVWDCMDFLPLCRISSCCNTVFSCWSLRIFLLLASNSLVSPTSVPCCSIQRCWSFLVWASSSWMSANVSLILISRGLRSSCWNESDRQLDVFSLVYKNNLPEMLWCRK